MVSKLARLLRCPTSVWGLVAVCALAPGAVALAPATASGNPYNPYCGEVVPPHTDCATNPGHYWDWWDGRFNTDEAYYQPGGISVCEHTYIYGTATTVSDRCGTSSISSYCDLYYYYNGGYSLSGHAGNNSAVSHTIFGYVYNSSLTCT
jgi:hypothetical protein